MRWFFIYLAVDQRSIKISKKERYNIIFQQRIFMIYKAVQSFLAVFLNFAETKVGMK